MSYSDDDLALFYYGYQTFITAADEIIAEYSIQRQHHRFLFFINKRPGISVKELLILLEISKQGAHSTLKKLKELQLIEERQSPIDQRYKELYVTNEGRLLIEKLNKTQIDLFQSISSEKGDSWKSIMEGFADYRAGYHKIKETEDKG